MKPHPFDPKLNVKFFKMVFVYLLEESRGILMIVKYKQINLQFC